MRRSLSRMYIRYSRHICRAICHDPNIYPNPELFNPDRYFKDGVTDHAVLDPGVIAFGFGRRCVQGVYLLRRY